MTHLMKCPQCEGKGKVLDSRSLGAELRKQRIQRGISLRSMARIMHISAPFLSDLERGNRTLTPERIRDYTRALQKP